MSVCPIIGADVKHGLHAYGLPGARTISLPHVRGVFFVTFFFGAVEARALNSGVLPADLRPLVDVFPLRFASIHFDISAEQALASSATAIPFPRAIASANDTCAALGGLGPDSPTVSSVASRAGCFGACRSRKARQIDPDLV